jgi:hypothetical protein
MKTPKRTAMKFACEKNGNEIRLQSVGTYVSGDRILRQNRPHHPRYEDSYD